MPTRHARTQAAIISLATRVLLRDARQIQRNLDAVTRAGLVETTPAPWQVCLGVVRMLHRIAFRTGSIGLSSNPVRPTRRARWFAAKQTRRLPFVLAEGSVVPGDLSGLASSPEVLRRHMLGTHHDGHQFGYDLQLLAIHPGELERLRDEARAVVEQDTRRSRWLQDLCIYEGYHATLLEVVEAALRDDWRFTEADASNPDISLAAWLTWCAAQPETPAETLRAVRDGRWHPERGLDGAWPPAVEPEPRIRVPQAA